MKVAGPNLNIHNLQKTVSFEGYKPVKSDFGKREYEFNYVYDDEHYDCYLELFSVDNDDGNWFVIGEKSQDNNIKPLLNKVSLFDGKIEDSVKLESGKTTRVDLTNFGIQPGDAFAYHYVLRWKGDQNSIPQYKVDPGNTINSFATSGNWSEVYNVVTDRASTVSKGGAMKLILPDNNNVAWIYDKNNNIVQNPNLERARKTNKTFANKIGGSLAGIEKDLEDGKLDNFTKIITTPLFTDDSLTSHGYWNKNCMQMAHSLGNINNYASLQRKLFAKGMNLVSDGAYVNEGLEGAHFKHVLLWGKESPFYKWFRISGLEDSPLSMGVFGKKMQHVTHRIVNSKYNFVQNDDGSIKISENKNYKSNEPTYIQIYDDRLVDTEKLKDNELIKAYDKPIGSLEINNHNDTVVPYSFKIDSEVYKKNVEWLSKYNKNKSDKKERIKLYSGAGTASVAQFENFILDGKHESGFETWDANPDIAKLSYIPSHKETQDLKNIQSREEKNAAKNLIGHKNIEVQDYAVTSAGYWTKKTRQILLLNAAQNLKNIDGKNAKEILEVINSLSDGKKFPENLDVNEAIITNVLNNKYELFKNDTVSDYNNAILQGLMNLPLDSIEVGDDIVSVLSSPYMTKRATKEEQIGVSRYDMYVNGNKHLTPEYKNAYEATDRMYKNEMFKFAKSILDQIEENLPDNKKFHDKDGNTTSYGKYVLPLLTAEIARFAVIKAVSPNAEFKYSNANGEISYDYNKTKSTSLLGMGIIAGSPEYEAVTLIRKLKQNIGDISTGDKEKLVKALSLSIQGTSYNSFALADMIVSRTESGLDWRIDATKDIADIDSLRNGKTNFSDTWNPVIKFWSKFTDAVRKYHPDAYIAAEVTDSADIYNRGDGGNSGPRYSDVKEVVKKLINEAGFTTVANYEYFSSSLTQIFGKLFDYDGWGVEKGTNQGETIRKKIIDDRYYTSEPLESLLYSYTFAGNHDKCRALEGYAVDMDMVYVDLTDSANREYRQRAYKILHGMAYGNDPDDDFVDGYDYSHVSNLAIAKAESISSGMGKALNDCFTDTEPQRRKTYLYGKMLEALANLSNDRTRGQLFGGDGFGTKDFDTAVNLVLEEMDYLIGEFDKRLTEEEKTKLKKKTLEKIIDPAMSKLLGHIKFLVALPGNPTLFAGDEYGSTGFETTTKNMSLQNRNIIREDWADPESPDYMEFVKRFKGHVDYQFNLRKRPELRPLNDGTPFVLDPQGINNKDTKLSAILRQSPNGQVTVSVFNTEGITHKYDEYYSPERVEMNRIDLNCQRALEDKFQVLNGLRPGMKFYSASELNKPEDERVAEYVVKERKEGDYETVYEIARQDGRPITINDSVLILYNEPPKNSGKLSFTGRRTLYNPQYNIASKPYANINKKQVKVAQQLQLISK